MSVEICGTIYKTNDYDMFKIIEGNRKLNPCNYLKMLKSMREEQLIIPILINEKNEIIDGQHRYSACKELGLPVYYYIVEGYGLSQVKRANVASSNWKKEDYLQTFVTEGVDDYKQIQGLIERYSISLCTLLKIFAKVQKKSLKEIDGTFINGSFKTVGFSKVDEFLTCLEDFNYHSNYKSQTFIIAFMTLFFKDTYKHEQMLLKVAKYGDNLDRRSTYDDYLVLLCNKLYSFGRTSKPIYYSKESQKFHN